MGGNDTVTGNGNTRVSYDNATAGVTVTLGAGGSGTATGDDSIGTDTFISGVSRVRGSDFADTITGNGGNNFIEGQGGDDTLTGGGGLDRFIYSAVNDGLDHITDFSGHGGQNDELDFDHLAFGSGLAVGGANTGTLDASHFVAECDRPRQPRNKCTGMTPTIPRSTTTPMDQEAAPPSLSRCSTMASFSTARTFT